MQGEGDRSGCCRRSSNKVTGIRAAWERMPKARSAGNEEPGSGDGGFVCHSCCVLWCTGPALSRLAQHQGSPPEGDRRLCARAGEGAGCGNHAHCRGRRRRKVRRPCCAPRSPQNAAQKPSFGRDATCVLCPGVSLRVAVGPEGAAAMRRVVHVLVTTTTSLDPPTCAAQRPPSCPM